MSDSWIRPGLWLSCYGNRGSAKYSPALFLLHKNHGMQILALPLRTQCNGCVSGKRGLVSGLCFTDLANASNDCGVVQIFAGVFPAFHRGMKPRFRNGQPDFRRVTMTDLRKFVD